MIYRGSYARARAMPTLFRIPPLSSEGYLFSADSKPTNAKLFLTLSLISDKSISPRS